MSQPDQHQQYVVQTDINHTMPAPVNQAANSIHFEHTYSTNIQAMPTPAPLQQAPPAAAPMASVPTNQISARGISFAQPQPVHSNNVNPTPMQTGSIPAAQNHVVLTSSMPYCLTASGNDGVPAVATSGKVRTECIKLSVLISCPISNPVLRCTTMAALPYPGLQRAFSRSETVLRSPQRQQVVRAPRLFQMCSRINSLLHCPRGWSPLHVPRM